MMNLGALSLLRKLPHSPCRLRQMSRCLPVITEIIKDRLRDQTLHPWLVEMEIFFKSEKCSISNLQV